MKVTQNEEFREFTPINMGCLIKTASKKDAVKMLS